MGLVRETGGSDLLVGLAVPVLDHRADVSIWRMSEALYAAGVPARMSDAQITALQTQGQGLEEVQDAASLRRRGQAAVEELPFACLLLQPKEPVVAGLLFLSEQVELMVAQSDLGQALFHQSRDAVDHADTVGTTVHQVSNKDQASALSLCAAVGPPQGAEQLLKGLDLAVYVSNDVQRVRGQWADPIHQESISRFPSLCLVFGLSFLCQMGAFFRLKQAYSCCTSATVDLA